MMSKRLVYAAAYFLAAVSSPAQIVFGGRPPAQTAPQARHDVTGSVVNAVTGEPVRKALVTVDAQDGPHVAFSDASGAFAIEGVPDGRSVVRFQKPGFQTAQFGNASEATFINVSAAAESVTLKVWPLSSVAGRVIDDQGHGVEGIVVQAQRSVINEGWKQWLPTSGATTDEDGRFELDDLPPASYRLRTGMRAAPVDAVSTRQANVSSLPRFVYPPVYLGGSSDASAAQVLELKSGQTLEADFEVKAVPGFRIDGMISGAGAPAWVTVEDAEGETLGIQTGLNRQTGRFVLPAVPAGQWRIVAQSRSQANEMRGTQLVSVESGNIQNVRLQLEPVATYPVHIVHPGSDEPPPLQLRLINLHPSFRRGDEFATPQRGSGPAADMLQFQNVMPGQYRLSARVLGGSDAGGSCIDSVRAGSGDVLRDGLTVQEGGAAQEITVTLRNDCASLDPKVNYSGSAEAVTAILIADDPGMDPAVAHIPMSPANTRGGNMRVPQFSNLRPGSYRLYVFDNANDLEYSNPGAMRAFEGQQITLSPNQHAEVTADVIARANP